MPPSPHRIPVPRHQSQTIPPTSAERAQLNVVTSVKARLAGYGIGPNPYPESPGQRLGPDIGNRSTDQKRVGLTDGQTTQVGRARRPAMNDRRDASHPHSTTDHRTPLNVHSEAESDLPA